MTIQIEFITGKSASFSGIKTIKEEDGYLKIISTTDKGLGFLMTEVVMFFTVQETKNKVVN